MKDYSRVYARIDLDAIRNNMEALKHNTKRGTKICAVLKTDGYGHGAVPIARTIEDLVWGYAVATIDEASMLRINQISQPILVLGYVPECRYREAIDSEIRITVFEKEQAENLEKTAAEMGKMAHVHVKIDTGMGRIGMMPDENAVSLIKEMGKMPHLDLEGIFTHMATADMADKTAAKEQVRVFCAFLAKVEETGISIPIRHCSNSAGIIEMEESHLDMVRAGISLYGFYPSDEVGREQVSLTPAMELKSTVIYVKTVPSHTPISYGATYVTEGERRIATIPVGYGDGYPRALSNRGYVLIHGKKAPICGRICMDQMMVDVSDIPDTREGDEVTLLGKDGSQVIRAEELAEMVGSFHYEFVCGIGKRVPRIYVKEGRIVGCKDYFQDRYDDFL